MGRARQRKRDTRARAPAAPREPRVPAAAVAALFFIGALALYAGSYRNPPVFDDRVINPPQLEEFLRMLYTFRPRWVSYSTFGLNYLASGLDLAGYRLANVLLHAGVALALFAFVRRLLKRAAPAVAHTRREAAALAAGAVVLVHPVSVYAVGYLAQRSIVMAALFCVLALHAFLVGLERDERRWYWAAVGLYVLAVWSKEHAVMLPAVAAALALALYGPDRRLALRLALPMAGFALAALAIVLQVRGVLGASYEPYLRELVSEAAAGDAQVSGSYAQSIATQALLFFRSVFLWILPWPGWMSGDIRVALAPSITHWSALAGAACFLAWGAASMALLVRRGLAAVAGFGMLLPWLLFFTEFAAVRLQEPFVLYRGYLWMIGLPVVLAALAVRLAPGTLTIAAVATGALLVAGTRDRLESFSTPYRFWDDVVRKNRDHALPFVDRGLSNRAVALMHLGRYTEALPDLEQAIRLNPRNAHAWINRATVRSNFGQMQGALADADEALRLDPRFGEGYAERCSLRMKAGRDGEALEDCNRALELSPSYPPALLNRGVLLARRGRMEEAIADFDGILRYDAGNALALYNRGMALAQAGRHEESLDALRAACKQGMQAACQPAGR
ncbi:MAG: tetratricopeptide repeat protein [Burkholderiales bacterium]|nr:tetratricopeptide repeat protein [Burkholderiales bacterium]